MVFFIQPPVLIFVNKVTGMPRKGAKKGVENRVGFARG